MKSIVLIFFLLLTNFVNATNWYVDAGAAGTNSGTLANPWTSIASINQSSINAGDSLLFRAGDTFTGTFTFTRSGSSGNPIVISRYGTGANPKFTGTGSTITYLFRLTNRSYVTFDRLHITDPSINLADSSELSKIQRCFTFDGSSSNNRIQNCFIELCGVAAYFPSGGNTITGCEVTNLRMIVSDVGGGGNDYGANPVIMESGNNTITYNYFHDCYAQCEDFGYDGGAVEFYNGGADNNVIMYNRIENCLVLSEFGSGSGGTIENNLIAYNILINNGCVFYVNTSGGFAVAINNIQLYNNTIIEQRQNVVFDTYMIGLQTNVATAGQFVVKNNIFYLRAGLDVGRSGQFTGTAMTHTNNLYNLGSGSTTNFTLHASEKSETTAIFSDQSNVNAGNWNIRLAANSPARNMGTSVGISTDYAGSPVPSTPDAGVYQYSTGQTTGNVRRLKFIQGN